MRKIIRMATGILLFFLDYLLYKAGWFDSLHDFKIIAAIALWAIVLVIILYALKDLFKDY